jgi:predicted ATPase
VLVDRDGELAAVDRVLSAARAGAGAALLVEGPPGIGKTSLLAAARDSAGCFRVLSARGSELERDFPFAVARQLLEGALEPELLTGAAALAAPVLMDSAAEAGPAALHGLYWLTANLAARTPLLVVADDLHWADVASLRWLAYLVQRLDGLACAVVVGTRPAEGDHGLDVLDVLATHPSVEALHPGGLSVAATARIVERELGSPEESFAAACHAVTGGNPFLLGELIDAVREQGLAPSAAAAAHVGRHGPAAVARSVVLRLAQLPLSAARVAEAVAVLHPDATLPLVAALAELTTDEAARAAVSLQHARLLVDGEPLRFAHAILRAAVYEDLPALHRGQAHGRAARILHARGAPPTGSRCT